MTQLHFRTKTAGTAFADPDSDEEKELAPASSPKIKLPRASEEERPTLDEQWEDMLADEQEEESYSSELGEVSEPEARPDKVYRGAASDGSGEDEPTHNLYGPTSESRERSKPRRRWSNKKVTAKDLTVLRLLGQFQYGTAEQLRAAFEGEVGTSKGAKRRKSGQAVSAGVMLKRLKALEELGLVEQLTFGRKLWFSTQNGASVAGLDHSVYRAHSFSPNQIGHVLALFQMAAAFTGAQEEGIKFTKRHDVLGEGAPLGGEFVTESVIQAHFETMASATRSKLKAAAKPGADITQSQAHTTLAQHCEEAVRAKNGEELDGLLADKPSLWCASRVWDVRGKERSYKRSVTRRPDLVIARPHDEAGRAQSVAVEIELSGKYSADEFKNFMRAYSNWRKVYGRVVWVYKDERTRRKLEAAIEATDTGDLISVVPLRNSDGTVFSGNVLMEL